MSDEWSNLERMEADLAYWRVLEEYIPQWRVFGWTYRRGASIETNYDPEGARWGQTLQLTGSQRDQIVEALYRAEGKIK
jgi:hypothetical protein